MITTEYSGYGYIGLPSELTAQQYLLFRRYLTQRIQQEIALTKIFGQSSNEMLERFLPDNTDIRLEGLCKLQEHLAHLEGDNTTEQMGEKIIPILKVMFRSILSMFNSNAGQDAFPSDMIKPSGREWTAEEADTIDSHVAMGGVFATHEEATAAAYDIESAIEILRLVTDASIDHDPQNQRRNSYLMREWGALADACSGASHTENRLITGADVLPELEFYCLRRVMYDVGAGLPSDFLMLQAANVSAHVTSARLHFGIVSYADYWAKVDLCDEECQVSENFEYCSWVKMMHLLEGRDKGGFMRSMQKAMGEVRNMMGIPRKYDVSYLAPYRFYIERNPT